MARKVGIYYAFWTHEGEADFLPFTSGSIARVRVSEQRANLVVG